MRIPFLGSMFVQLKATKKEDLLEVLAENVFSKKFQKVSQSWTMNYEAKYFLYTSTHHTSKEINDFD